MVLLFFLPVIFCITADTMNDSFCHLISDLIFLTVMFSLIFLKKKKQKTHINLKLASVP